MKIFRFLTTEIFQSLGKENRLRAGSCSQSCPSWGRQGHSNPALQLSVHSVLRKQVSQLVAWQSITARPFYYKGNKNKSSYFSKIFCLLPTPVSRNVHGFYSPGEIFPRDAARLICNFYTEKLFNLRGLWAHWAHWAQGFNQILMPGSSVWEGPGSNRLRCSPCWKFKGSKQSWDY